MAHKYVYAFGAGRAEGDGSMRTLLGGKGAGLMEMTRIGLPVPAGFVLTTEACALYLAQGRRALKPMASEVRRHMRRLERTAGRQFGDAHDPLLVSVRSGAARSMPGMMETILNLGLNDRTVEVLAGRTGNARFAYDAYRRFLGMYGSIVLGLPKSDFDHLLAGAKARCGVRLDTEVPAAELRTLCGEMQALVRQATGKAFPQEPEKQLWGAIEAVFRSWVADKSVTYRRVERITGLAGTGVNVQQMVFGNLGETSGTGVAFTRDPNTGEKVFYGDLLMNAQGEDVVAGIRTPLGLKELARRMPRIYRQLDRVRILLEKHYRDMQDLEFTIEDGTLYLLQCRTGKRSPRAAFRMAADMAREKLISKEEAVLRVAPEDVERLFYPVLDSSINQSDLASRKLAVGIGAVPGAAVGRLAFTARDAEARGQAGRNVILVRRETSPEDVGGMHAAQGILTATGGKTSHAAVVARGWGKTCIVGCEAIDVDPQARTMKVDGRVLHDDDPVTLDGSTGTVYAGEFALVKPELPPAYQRILMWADGARRLKVRANVDTPYDAKKAIDMGAEGIGLCRTEHMFFDTEERRLAIQEMILAADQEARVRALDTLLPFQRRDFEGIFEAMSGRPVTIRLLDPPLHEFVPHDDDGQRALAGHLGIPVDTVRQRVTQLHESNPMLGHRGCRLSLTYPEILDMQVRAIVEAAVAVRRRGGKVHPEIMHPLTIDAREMALLARRTREVADRVLKESRARIDYLVGTMIEVPRAALTAGAIAREADFFSFGTNDLTQMTMALSRDDSGRFLPEYVDERRLGIFASDPFQILDEEGVGELIRMAIERGRASRPGLKIGICGEHGGEAHSVTFCHKVGMDYVSASTYRIPIARLAAAQAAIRERQETPARRRGGGGGNGSRGRSRPRFGNGRSRPVLRKAARAGRNTVAQA
jgi:pyruvate,orthophosphate dikinase